MESSEPRGLAAYRSLPRGWWIAAGVIFGLFTAVRLVVWSLRHDAFWTVPFGVLSYALLALQLLSLGRRRQIDAEIKRLQVENARLGAEIDERARVIGVR